MVYSFVIPFIKYSRFVSQRQGGQGVQQPAGFNTGRLFRLGGFQLPFES